MIHLDTHVVAWLYSGSVERLSEAAREALEEHELAISPMVMVELHYLHEIGRTTAPGDRVVAGLESAIGLRLCEQSFFQVATAALEESWTPDPFDRLIVGHAASLGVDLLTKDRTIREHYARAFW